MATATTDKPQLMMEMGLPRSGKSTHALSTGHPIVSPDAVRLALHGEAYLPNAERLVWTMVHYMVVSLFAAGHQTVVLDATNISHKRRKEWQSKKWDRVLVVHQTPADECIERAILNGREELVEVIKRMNRDWEPVMAPEAETFKVIVEM